MYYNVAPQTPLKKPPLAEFLNFSLLGVDTFGYGHEYKKMLVHETFPFVLALKNSIRKCRNEIRQT
jgi:hypothetical protein